MGCMHMAINKKEYSGPSMTLYKKMINTYTTLQTALSPCITIINPWFGNIFNVDLVIICACISLHIYTIYVAHFTKEEETLKAFSDVWK